MGYLRAESGGATHFPGGLCARKRHIRAGYGYEARSRSSLERQERADSRSHRVEAEADEFTAFALTRGTRLSGSPATVTMTMSNAHIDHTTSFHRDRLRRHAGRRTVSGGRGDTTHGEIDESLAPPVAMVYRNECVAQAFSI